MARLQYVPPKNKQHCELYNHNANTTRQEATSGEIDFPESDPDLVDMLLRHLYGQGKVTITTCALAASLTSITDLDVRDLKTPALCVRCWILADYVQLETLKNVVISSLGQHFDAMALLARSSYWDDGPQPPPKWLTYLLEGLREVCRDDTTKPIHTIFTAFLWVTRFELLNLPEMLDTLERSHGVNKKLMRLLVFANLDNEDSWPDWFDYKSCSQSIARRSIIYFDRIRCCSECKRSVTEEELVFYNPFPVSTKNMCFDIGEFIWCKGCATKVNEKCRWPWRSYRIMKGDKVKLEAWTWSDDE